MIIRVATDARDTGACDVTYLVSMNLHVLLQVGAGAEALVTDLTQKGLLARVDSLVADEVRDL